MNYKKTHILFLFSAIILFGCHYSQGVAAKPPQHTQKIASLLPPQASAEALITPLTYNLETYTSQVMGGSRTYGISLPPGYAENPQQRYPVIFLLHGGHGNPEAWFDQNKGQLTTTLQKLYTSGKLPPSIIITPDGNDKRGSSPYWDPQYIDGKNGKVSTAIGDELVKVIQSRYRTLPSPDFWAMGGLSSGGWGAMNIGLHHSQNFSILFSHSGYFKDNSGAMNSPIISIKYVPKADKKRLRIYLDSGTTDTEEVAENKNFAKVLKEEKVYHLVQEFSGGHTWQYWREHLTDSLTFVGEQLRFFESTHDHVTPLTIKK
jgi:enterochelin esterase-like enzyme